MRQLAGVVLVLFAACGDNVHGAASAPLDDTAPDAAVVASDAAALVAADATPDATPDAGTFQNRCSYIEQQDLTNDYEQVPGAEEDTPWLIGPWAGAGFVLCGNINVGHYDATTRSIDVDRFTFQVARTTTVTLNFSGDEEIIRLLSSNYGSNSQVGVFLRDHATGQTLYTGSFFQSDTVTFTATVPTGPYGALVDLDVEAYDDQEDIFLSAPYAIEVLGS